MSDIVPTTTNHTGGLVSRQAHTPSAAPPPQMGVFKPENLQIAEAMARATDLLPREYAGKPGACLLAMDWAERNDIAILDVLANVSFVHGKPVIGARMQKKLAARVGYRTAKIEGDETFCTVAVYGPDNVEIGRATYTMEMAQALNLPARSPVWKADPAQMLFHRATTRALDHYGPGELSVLFVDETPEVDPVDTVRDALGPVGAVESELAGTSGPGEGEPVQRPAPPPPAVGGEDADVTGDDLKAAIKAASKTMAGAIREVQSALGAEFATLDDIAADPQATDHLLRWVDA